MLVSGAMSSARVALRKSTGATQFRRQAFPASSVLLSRNLSTSSPRYLIKAPPMVYISGEEMTRYACELMLEKWVKPEIDISQWEYYDLSCKSRDDTEDKVLHDAVEAGARIGAIFKEPTITPSAVQVTCYVTKVFFHCSLSTGVYVLHI